MRTRTALMIVGLFIFTAPAILRRQARLAHAVVTQSNTGKRAKAKVVSRHAGRYNPLRDLAGAFSGHGIGWGDRVAL